MAALDFHMPLSHNQLQEMYYRHLYATLAQPTLEQRRKSWENYVRLFNIMLNTQVNMQVCTLRPTVGSTEWHIMFCSFVRLWQNAHRQKTSSSAMQCSLSAS